MGLMEQMFETSPFEPLIHHHAQVRACVGFVRPMFEAARDGNYEKLCELRDRVFKSEHEADIIKDEIRQVIPRSFFLPVYRGDLLGYLKLQDDMADEVEDVAILLTIKRLAIPPRLVDQVFEYMETVLKACDKCFEMNEHLRELVSRGFRAEEANGIFEMIRSIERAEWEADKAQYMLSQALFALEDEIRPTDLILWWRVFRELGQLANHAENLGDRLRRMLSR